MNNTHQAITIVTGNKGKLHELQALARGTRHTFTMHVLELDEIQSMDLGAIVTDKARRAYEILQRPVIIEDVAAGLTSLNGLPGPFIKFFNQRMGNDALYRLAAPDDQVTITCIAAYYNGQQLLLGQGTITGNIVAPRGAHGFGFDSVVMPTGQDRTMAEMSADEKSQISHRGKAFRALLQQLAEQNT